MVPFREEVVIGTELPLAWEVVIGTALTEGSERAGKAENLQNQRLKVTTVKPLFPVMCLTLKMCAFRM